MKKYLYILYIMLFNNISAQNIIVVDSTNHNPIPFVNIQFNKSDGTYTNEKGVFELSKNIKDTLKLNHMSYNTYEIKVSEVKDTIILSPNAIILKEIKITNTKKAIKYIDFPRNKNSFSSWPVSSKSEMISLIIPSKENTDAFIEKLNFSFVKKKEKNGNFSNQTAIRVNIYKANKSKKVKNKIYSSKVLILNPNKKDMIELNLENDLIEFSENGLYIGLEVIGDIDSSGNIIKDKAFLHAKLTDNYSDDYSAETYIKYVFDRKLNLIPINDIIKESSGKQINRNLSFGITISKSN